MKRCVHCGDPFEIPYPSQHARTTCSSACAEVRERQRTRLKKFGLTLEAYDALWVKQGGRCGICRKREEPGERRLAIDHDHACCPGKGSCGKCVRGLLCSPCNTGLGGFGDNPRLLRVAAEYIETVGVGRGGRILEAEWGSAVFPSEGDSKVSGSNSTGRAMPFSEDAVP